MSVVADVFEYLEAQCLAGGSTGWSLLRRRDMDGPALKQLVVVAEDGGMLPELSAAEGIGDSALADPGVLITVRGAPWDGDGSGEKARAIYEALHNLRDVVLGGSGAAVYLRVRALTPEPIFSGYDEQGRPRHTIAFRLLRQAVQ